MLITIIHSILVIKLDWVENELSSKAGTPAFLSDTL